MLNASRPRRRWLIFFPVLVLSLLWGAGCSKKSDLGTLNVPLRANLKGLDPINANDVYSNEVIGQVYEPLLQYHYLKRPLELEPLVAEEMPKVTDNGLTHTFKIRKGVFFHDHEAFPGGKGREVTAEDFIYSWKRLADPANQSEGFWVFDARIVGLNEWRDKVAKNQATYETRIEGLQAPDAQTLVIRLTRPFYQLHYVLAMNYTAVVPREVVDKFGKEMVNHAVGTGPFVFKKWIRGSKVELVKNANYRSASYPSTGEAADAERGLLKDAGEAMPFIEKVTFHELPEDQPRWLKFLMGELDYSGIPKDNFASAVKGQDLSDDLKSKGIKLSIISDPDTTYVAFNMVDPILGKNIHLRQAMSLAYDRATLIRDFYNGRAIPAQSPVAPDVDGYDRAFVSPYSRYDLGKAKALLAKAGFPDGKGLPEFEYSAEGSTTSRQMAEFFKLMMAKIGVKIRISTSSWPQLNEKVREKRAQIFGMAWIADYPDAETFLQLFFGKNISPGSNGANYQDPIYDEYYSKAAVTPPGPERTKLYHKMRDRLVEQAPWIFASHRLSYTVVHDWVGNFKYHPMISNTLKYLRVDDKRRAEYRKNRTGQSSVEKATP